MSLEESQPATRPLDRLQRWMQEVITHPDGIAAGISSESATGQISVSPETVEDVIGPSQSLGSIERLSVYGNAYFARLVECLGDEFPALKHALGEDIFVGFAMGYLQRYPSESYTLSDLSRRFPDYLRESRPADIEAPAWPDFLIDLATYERTCADIFDGPGVEGQQLLDPEALSAVAPDDVPHVVLHPAPCLRLLELQFPAHEYVTAVRRDQSPEQPEPQQTFLVMTRRDFIVRRGPVSRSEFLLLRAILDGKPLGEAIESAVAETDADLEQFASQLSGWFRHWTAAGWFVSFQPPSRRQPLEENAPR